MSTGKSTSPKEIDIESLARSYTEAGIRRLGGLATCQNTPEATAIEAIKILLDRGYGRPKQTKEHTGPGGGDIRVTIRNLIAEAKNGSS